MHHCIITIVMLIRWSGTGDVAAICYITNCMYKEFSTVVLPLSLIYKHLHFSFIYTQVLRAMAYHSGLQWFNECVCQTTAILNACLELTI